MVPPLAGAEYVPGLPKPTRRINLEGTHPTHKTEPAFALSRGSWARVG